MGSLEANRIVVVCAEPLLATGEVVVSWIFVFVVLLLRWQYYYAYARAMLRFIL